MTIDLIKFRIDLDQVVDLLRHEKFATADHKNCFCHLRDARPALDALIATRDREARDD